MKTEKVDLHRQLKKSEHDYRSISIVTEVRRYNRGYISSGGTTQLTYTKEGKRKRRKEKRNRERKTKTEEGKQKRRQENGNRGRKTEIEERNP